MKHYSLVALLALMLALGACNRVDNNSLPSYPVRIDLTYGRWNTYGPNGVGDYRIFNRDKKQPSNFPYDINTYTGYGGVLVIIGQDLLNGDFVPLAYEMSCPVEARGDVVVQLEVNDKGTTEAVCPMCKSRYDVEFQAGRAVSGMAVTRNKGMNAYHVRFVSDRAQYMNYGCTIVN